MNFLKKLTNSTLPKVSILIPTYNRPHYLQHALITALNQTYGHIEIIISDSSDNEETERIIRNYKSQYGGLIHYYRNDDKAGGKHNFHHCFDHSTGEYINYLMDDDLFHYQKVEKMMNFFLKYDDISLVTSRREIIDEEGRVTRQGYRLFQNDTVIDGMGLGNLMLKQVKNVIGEPTTVLFKKKNLDEPFGIYAGVLPKNSADLASWLNLLEKGKAGYISESLSCFRKHKQQLSNQAYVHFKKRLDWLSCLMNARRRGFLNHPEDIKLATARLNRYLRGARKHPFLTEDLQELLDKLEELLKFIKMNHGYTDQWKQFNHTYKVLRKKLNSR